MTNETTTEATVDARQLNGDGPIKREFVNNGKRKDVTITRVSVMTKRGAGYEYTVRSEGEFDASATRLDEVVQAAKLRANGGKVVKAWDTPAAKAERKSAREFKKAFTENKYGELA